MQLDIKNNFLVNLCVFSKSISESGLFQKLGKSVQSSKFDASSITKIMTNIEDCEILNGIIKLMLSL